MQGFTENILYWIVGIVMLYTGWIWLVSRKHQIRMDSRIIAYTLFLQGIAYIITRVFGHPSAAERIISLKIVILLMCLAQAVPLTISYFRTIKRENGA